jgi:hypothetical protein
MVEMHDEIGREDIKYIISNPWSISIKEWQLDDPSTHDTTMQTIDQRLEVAKTDGFAKIWKNEEQLPIALLGFYNVGYKIYETFFIASALMDMNGRKVTVDLRKLLQEKEATDYRNCRCRLYSQSDHPKQIEWFKFIGFEYFPMYNRGDVHYFEYVSKYK